MAKTKKNKSTSSSKKQKPVSQITIDGVVYVYKKKSRGYIAKDKNGKEIRLKYEKKNGYAYIMIGERRIAYQLIEENGRLCEVDSSFMGRNEVDRANAEVRADERGQKSLVLPGFPLPHVIQGFRQEAIQAGYYYKNWMHRFALESGLAWSTDDDLEARYGFILERVDAERKVYEKVVPSKDLFKHFKERALASLEARKNNLTETEKTAYELLKNGSVTSFYDFAVATGVIKALPEINVCEFGDDNRKRDSDKIRRLLKARLEASLALEYYLSAMDVSNDLPDLDMSAFAPSQAYVDMVVDGSDEMMKAYLIELGYSPKEADNYVKSQPQATKDIFLKGLSLGFKKEVDHENYVKVYQRPEIIRAGETLAFEHLFSMISRSRRWGDVAPFHAEVVSSEGASADAQAAWRSGVPPVELPHFYGEDLTRWNDELQSKVTYVENRKKEEVWSGKHLSGFGGEWAADLYIRCTDERNYSSMSSSHANTVRGYYQQCETLRMAVGALSGYRAQMKKNEEAQYRVHVAGVGEIGIIPYYNEKGLTAAATVISQGTDGSSKDAADGSARGLYQSGNDTALMTAVTGAAPFTVTVGKAVASGGFMSTLGTQMLPTVGITLAAIMTVSWVAMEVEEWRIEKAQEYLSSVNADLDRNIKEADAYINGIKNDPRINAVRATVAEMLKSKIDQKVATPEEEMMYAYLTENGQLPEVELNLDGSFEIHKDLKEPTQDMMKKSNKLINLQLEAQILSLCMSIYDAQQYKTDTTQQDDTKKTAYEIARDQIVSTKGAASLLENEKDLFDDSRRPAINRTSRVMFNPSFLSVKLPKGSSNSKYKKTAMRALTHRWEGDTFSRDKGDETYIYECDYGNAARNIVTPYGYQIGLGHALFEKYSYLSVKTDRLVYLRDKIKKTGELNEDEKKEFILFSAREPKGKDLVPLIDMAKSYFEKPTEGLKKELVQGIKQHFSLSGNMDDEEVIAELMDRTRKILALDDSASYEEICITLLSYQEKYKELISEARKTFDFSDTMDDDAVLAELMILGIQEDQSARRLASEIAKVSKEKRVSFADFYRGYDPENSVIPSDEEYNFLQSIYFYAQNVEMLKDPSSSKEIFSLFPSRAKRLAIAGAHSRDSDVIQEFEAEAEILENIVLILEKSPDAAAVCARMGWVYKDGKIDLSSIKLKSEQSSGNEKIEKIDLLERRCCAILRAFEGYRSELIHWYEMVSKHLDSPSEDFAALLEDPKAKEYIDALVQRFPDFKQKCQEKGLLDDKGALNYDKFKEYCENYENEKPEEKDTSSARYNSKNDGVEVVVQEDQQDYGPLNDAIMNNEPVNELIKQRPGLINEKKGGYTPLLFAILYEREAVALELITRGANVNEPDPNGNTPLHCAISVGLSDVALELIERGANINEPNSEGNTPLHFAISVGLSDVALELIERGANINARNKSGYMPMGCAVTAAISEEKPNWEVVKKIASKMQVNELLSIVESFIVDQGLTEAQKADFVWAVFEGAQAKFSSYRKGLKELLVNHGSEEMLDCLVEKSNQFFNPRNKRNKKPSGYDDNYFTDIRKQIMKRKTTTNNVQTPTPSTRKNVISLNPKTPSRQGQTKTDRFFEHLRAAVDAKQNNDKDALAEALKGIDSCYWGDDGANIVSVDPETHLTAIQLAIQIGDKDLLEFLLDDPRITADFLQTKHNGQTALDFARAIYGPNSDIFHMVKLVADQKGASQHDHSKSQDLLYVTRQGDVTYATKCLKEGRIDVKSTTDDAGQTVLHWFAKNDRIDLLAEVLNGGYSDVTIRDFIITDNNGKSPLDLIPKSKEKSAFIKDCLQKELEEDNPNENVVTELLEQLSIEEVKNLMESEMPGIEKAEDLIEDRLKATAWEQVRESDVSSRLALNSSRNITQERETPSVTYTPSNERMS